MDWLAVAKFFRFLGDFLAMTSRATLSRKIVNTQSLSGVSLKTHILYLVVYVLRYIDLLDLTKSWTRLNTYNYIMKVVYISFQCYLISLFYGQLKYSYSKKFDTFNIPIFLFVSFALSFIFKAETKDFTEYILEYCYTASLILESLAILPQLSLSQDSGECEKLTAIYISFLGLYRLSYFIYFMIIEFTKERLEYGVDKLMIVTSLMQSVLYIDFFRVYFGYGKRVLSRLD